MEKKYYLGLDQGTTGTTALLFDRKWNQVSKGYCKVVQKYPKPGWVEHDGLQLYETLLQATEEALRKIGASADEIRCMGIDNQGETVIAWNRVTGIPVYSAIVWQDRRTAREVEQLKAKYGNLFLERTGLELDSYFGATKIKWILEQVPEAKELLKQGNLLVGTLDTWFIWKMTGGKQFVTDVVTASRTCLMNLEKLSWDSELLALMGIPKAILPEIRENAGSFGTTQKEAFLGAEIPITGSIVDQQAALLGQGCTEKGTIKTTYGTGCFTLMNTGEDRIQNQVGILSTLAYIHLGQQSYALDGGIYISGAAVEWLQNGIKVIESPKEADALALSMDNNGGVYFVPAFSGLAAPYWDSYARGMMIGITGGTTNAHLARATLEATAYQVKDVLDVLRGVSDLDITSMRVDGGGSNSRFMMQFQADLLGMPIEVPKISETTGLGVAYLAALGCGEIESFEAMRSNWQCNHIYEPKMSVDERETLIWKWHRSVERAKNWETETL